MSPSAVLQKVAEKNYHQKQNDDQIWINMAEKAGEEGFIGTEESEELLKEKELSPMSSLDFPIANPPQYYGKIAEEIYNQTVWFYEDRKKYAIKTNEGLDLIYDIYRKLGFEDYIRYLLDQKSVQVTEGSGGVSMCFDETIPRIDLQFCKDDSTIDLLTAGHELGHGRVIYDQEKNEVPYLARRENWALGKGVDEFVAIIHELAISRVLQEGQGNSTKTAVIKILGDIKQQIEISLIVTKIFDEGIGRGREIYNFSLDALKNSGAYPIKKSLNPKQMGWMNRFLMDNDNLNYLRNGYWFAYNSRLVSTLAALDMFMDNIDNPSRLVHSLDSVISYVRILSETKIFERLGIDIHAYTEPKKMSEVLDNALRLVK